LLGELGLCRFQSGGIAARLDPGRVDFLAIEKPSPLVRPGDVGGQINPANALVLADRVIVLPKNGIGPPTEAAFTSP
jgi:hypothetical protein